MLKLLDEGSYTLVGAVGFLILELKIIAAILERPAIEKILTHLGLDPQPPPRGRARQAGQDFAP